MLTTRHVEAQERFADLLLPDFTELNDEEINLNNYLHIDNLLIHLESNPSPIPSQNALRIILTLAARTMESNWTNGAISMEGVQSTNAFVRAMNEDYHNCIYKHSFSTRSIYILLKYRDTVLRQADEVLYPKIILLLRDFIVKLWPVTKVVKIDDPIVRSRPTEKAPRPRSQLRVTDFFRSDEKEVVEPKIGEEEYVSDSDVENSILKSALSMEEEVNKYETYNIETNPSISPTLFPVSLKRSPTPVSNLAKRSKIIENTKPSWTNIRVFDEQLLSERLNPRLNKGFGFWLMINWCFYCADKATALLPSLALSSHTAYHNIYLVQSKLLAVMWDFIEINLFHTYAHITRKVKYVPGKDALVKFFKSPRRQRIRIQSRLERTELLLYALLAQLSTEQKYWYDRVVEYVFNGLELKSNTLRPSCIFARELTLLAHDPALKDSARTTTVCSYTDNLDSMALRFKIVTTVFYWSLFFSNGLLVHPKQRLAPSEHLTPGKLVAEMALKFISVDEIYLKEFFYSIDLHLGSRIPRKYRLAMLVELANVLLLDFTQIVEHERIVLKRYDIDNEDEDVIDDDIEIIKEIARPWRRENFNQILAAIGDTDIYLLVVEDETYTSVDAFKQVWLKFTFLLEWMLQLVIDDYLATEEGLPDVLPTLKAADRIREDAIMSFVNSHKSLDIDDKFLHDLKLQTKGYLNVFNEIVG